MQKLPLLLAILFLTAINCFAQINFDKPKDKDQLPNPYTVGVARDVVIEAAIAMIKDMNIDIDVDKSKQEEGILIAKPVIFTKGTITLSQLEHYATCPAAKSQNWSRGRYSLQMVIEAIDPSHAKISVSTKIEGETQGLSGSSWVDCPSKGVLENMILSKLAERIQ